MARLTCLLCCLLLVLSIALGAPNACAVEEQVGKPSVKLRLSNVNDAQTCPSKPDYDGLLRKMLPSRGQEHLKLGSELEGLADRGVSQPGWHVS
jgi:hypothetical protein